MFKKNKIKIISTSFLLIINILIPNLKVNSQEFDPDFNKNHIISDYQMFDYNSMTESQIQNFLVSKNSYLANYYTDGWPITCDTKTGSDQSNCQTMSRMKASAIIYSAAQRYKVDPKFILVMLQKEQGLIQWPGTPPDKRLDWATGYAVCDGCRLDDPKVLKYKGFGKQVDNVAGAMRFYSNNASAYAYIKKAGTSYLINGEVIKPQNQPTANLYTYTPHISGNYTFWRVYQRYFGDPLATTRDKQATISTEYMAQMIDSSDREININEGERTAMWVEYLNMGTQTWFNLDKQSLYLIDSKYKSEIPIISKTSSFNLEESMKSDIAVYSQRESVAPGEVLRLTSPLEADYEKYKSGEYILVLNGKGWFTDSDIGFSLTRTFRYDAQLIKGIPSALEANQSNAIRVEYKNVGLMPWYRNDVKLQWKSLGYTNYQTMNEWKVNPGETASFTFYSKVDKVGEHIYETSLWKDVGWKLNKFPTGEESFKTNMTVKYAAKLIYESVPKEMTAGSEKYIMLRFKNVGTENWTDELVLRSYSKINPFSASYFKHNSWLTGMAVDKIKRTVRPGENYTFRFKIRAPHSTYAYDQYYQLEWGPYFKEIYIDENLTKHFITQVKP
jgi:hypothetical protein